MKIKLYKFKQIKVRLFMVGLMILFIQSLSAQCGADIFILNDNSGSVDATEYRQSKQFVSRLAIEMSPLGTATNQTRIAIGDFANTNQYIQYDFPVSTNNYTTQLSDIVSYENSPRVLGGGTNLGYGMTAASIVAGLPQIPGRNVAQVLVILTDAYPSQIPQSILNTVTTLKSKGFSVIVMAIGDAASDPKLPLVASSGGYFSAVDYQSLATNVIARAKALAAQACTYVPPTPMPDLTVALSAFTVKNCTTTPEYSVNYTANNVGNAAFSGNLYLSIYDADPRIPGAHLLGVYNAGTVNIAAGSSSAGIITGANIPNLRTAQNLFALVNFNGSATGNQVPVSSSISQTQLYLSPEADAQNNLSIATNLVSGAGCNMAILNTSVTSVGGACDDEVTYTVNICNTGLQPANVTGVMPFAAPGFVLTASTTPACAQIGGTLTQIGADIDGKFLDERFGSTVSLSSDGLTMLSSTGLTLGSNPPPQSAQVYDYNGISWIQRGSDIQLSSFPEYSVLSGNGNTVAILVDSLVKIYDWNGTAWQQRGLDLSIDSPVWNAGNSKLSLTENGNTLAIGGAGDFTDLRGAIFVYYWNGTAWIQRGDTIHGLKEDYDSTVSISPDGKFLAVGGRYYYDTNRGQLKSYAWNDTTSKWIQRGSTILGEATNDLGFGISVDISEDGNTIAAGAQYDSSIGLARVYQWSTSSNDWIKKGTDILGTNIGFGNDIQLSHSGNNIIIGSFTRNVGQVKVYDFNDNTWGLRGSIAPEAPTGDYWGYSVAMSANGAIIAASANHNSDGGVYAGHVRVYGSAVSCAPLAPGACATYTYTYDVTNAAAGTYDFDAILQATKTNAAHSDPIINPDKNFTAQNTATTGDGYDGSNHLEDNVTLFDNAFCATPHTLDIAVKFAPTSVCAGDFTAATVSITNPYPVNIYNTQINLNLNNGSLYVSEPYNVTNIVLPGNLGLNNSTGAKAFTVYSLAPGVNSFTVDVSAATGNTALTAQLTNIDPAYNNNSATTSLVSSNVTGVAAPTLTAGTCPAAVTTAATTVNLSYTFTGAASYKWSSGTNGVFASSTNPTTTYTINPQDYANGYIDFVLTAYSSIGCETIIPCRVNISGVKRDYGDAPVTYDLNERTVPVAAAHSLFTGLYLGVIPPDAETQNQPSVPANLDGVEEDGLLSSILMVPSVGSTYSLPITVTNTSSIVAYANAFIDWNSDGDFLDESETGIIATIPANSGTNTVNINFTVPSGVLLPFNSYVRLRTSLDDVAIKRPFAAAGGGEVEDFYVTLKGQSCYKPGIAGTGLPVNHGISALGRAGADNKDNWPMVRQSAWTALEAKTKGFVINRIPSTMKVNAIPNPVEGMMVYDEEADCLKIYTTTDSGLSFSWKCFTTQACPN